MDWRKATYSNSQGTCVEVATGATGTVVRDSQDTAGPVVSFTDTAWNTFLRQLKKS